MQCAAVPTQSCGGKGESATDRSHVAPERVSVMAIVRSPTSTRKRSSRPGKSMRSASSALEAARVDRYWPSDVGRLSPTARARAQLTQEVIQGNKGKVAAVQKASWGSSVGCGHSLR